MTTYKNPKVVFYPPVSSREGVALHQANFSFDPKVKNIIHGGRFIVQSQCTSKLDVHEVSECWMVASGKGVLTYDDQSYSIEAGDFLYFQPFKQHWVFNNGDEALVIHTIWWLA